MTSASSCPSNFSSSQPPPPSPPARPLAALFHGTTRQGPDLPRSPQERYPLRAGACVGPDAGTLDRGLSRLCAGSDLSSSSSGIIVSCCPLHLLHAGHTLLHGTVLAAIKPGPTCTRGHGHGSPEEERGGRQRRATAGAGAARL